jgi:hypothetical protein
MERGCKLWTAHVEVCRRSETRLREYSARHGVAKGTLGTRDSILSSQADPQRLRKQFLRDNASCDGVNAEQLLRQFSVGFGWE